MGFLFHTHFCLPYGDGLVWEHRQKKKERRKEERNSSLFCLPSIYIFEISISRDQNRAGEKRRELSRTEQEQSKSEEKRTEQSKNRTEQRNSSLFCLPSIYIFEISISRDQNRAGEKRTEQSKNRTEQNRRKK